MNIASLAYHSAVTISFEKVIVHSNSFTMFKTFSKKMLNRVGKSKPPCHTPTLMASQSVSFSSLRTVHGTVMSTPPFDMPMCLMMTPSDFLHTVLKAALQLTKCISSVTWCSIGLFKNMPYYENDIRFTSPCSNAELTVTFC